MIILKPSGVQVSVLVVSLLNIPVLGEIGGSEVHISLLGRALRVKSFKKTVNKKEVRESRTKKGKL